MSVLVRIAIRNLMEHKSKSFIIGTIVAVGIIVLIVGNSLMDTATLGIRRGFIDNYTGDIIINGLADGDVSLFGVQSPGGLEDTPTLPDFETIRSHLVEQEGIELVTSQVSGFARVSVDEMEGGAISVLFGIDPASYRVMFDNLDFTEGRDLIPGEEGIIMSRARLDEMVEEIIKETKKETGEEIEFSVNAGDDLRLTSFGNAGIKIREVPLVGIFELKHASDGLGIDLISYVDIQTQRALSALTISYQGEFDLDDSETALLDAESLDDFFSEDFSVEESGTESSFDTADLDSILGDTTQRDAALAIDTGSWHYLLATVRNPRKVEKTIRELNEWFEANGILAQAGNWEVAAGPFATTADVIRTVFNIAIIIVGVVALIIMMNTMIISIIERTSEIGTMRALGAGKRFVWKMFFIETVTITTIFGLAGVALSLGIVGLLNIIGIPATNVFLRILFAGDALRPTASLTSIISSVLIAIGVGILAHIYPVTVALKIAPIRAIQTE
ncbi:MAG: ABC transporter permease [Spirochaetales bacterium]|jgi:putative ABC transport system permease protein|nr:ABC transporter permease [Spirochaetales bacterium]